MRKLSLKLDDLTVESFETERLSQERGTVEAHHSSGAEHCHTCHGEWTCEGTCGFSCIACQTDEGACSSDCIIPTYVWQPC